VPNGCLRMKWLEAVSTASKTDSATSVAEAATGLGLLIAPSLIVHLLLGEHLTGVARGTEVPHTPDWLHEIKYDGYRLRLERDGDRVRLLTRNGYDWTRRYPWIVESALKNRKKHFVIDGEAVILGVDGRSNFDALHSEKHNEEVQFYAFDMLPATAMICGSFRSRCARPIWRSSWPVAPKASSSPHSSKARSARTCSGGLQHGAVRFGIEAPRPALSC
jgi:hypothetical protein